MTTYINEEGVKIDESTIDTSLGYLQPDKILIAHHDATPEVAEKFHYEVKMWYFDDGTCQQVLAGNKDESVKVINDQTGQFEYVGDMTYRGADIEKVVDSEKVEAKEAYDEYDEDVQRYILYTAEELAERQAQQEASEKQQNFLTNGPDQLELNTTSLGDLTILLSELVGGAE
jgi:hypothetical protein